MYVCMHACMYACMSACMYVKFVYVEGFKEREGERDREHCSCHLSKICKQTNR